jgi:ABC-type multidrug transport system fused ATPase/permease subunit
MGYDTMVGERGIRLSGGERQRIAIARAILKNPSIVVLDEATSALDSVTERAVQQGIKELIADRTSFIIAHRLSTVRSVHRIAVIENGRITACAPHEELMTQSAKSTAKWSNCSGRGCWRSIGRSICNSAMP